MTVAVQIDRLQIRTRYQISVLVRGEHDLLHWRPCGEHVTHSRAAVALDEWLLENEPAYGQYRAQDARDGYTVTKAHYPEQAA